jgi:hypothetical protein
MQFRSLVAVSLLAVTASATPVQSTQSASSGLSFDLSQLDGNALALGSAADSFSEAEGYYSITTALDDLSQNLQGVTYNTQNQYILHNSEVDSIVPFINNLVSDTVAATAKINVQRTKITKTGGSDYVVDSLQNTQNQYRQLTRAIINVVERPRKAGIQALFIPADDALTAAERKWLIPL